MHYFNKLQTAQALTKTIKALRCYAVVHSMYKNVSVDKSISLCSSFLLVKLNTMRDSVWLLSIHRADAWSPFLLCIQVALCADEAITAPSTLRSQQDLL